MTRTILLLLPLLCCACHTRKEYTEAPTQRLSDRIESPDGKLSFELEYTSGSQPVSAPIRYSLMREGRPIIAQSRLGLVETGGRDMGAYSVAVAVERGRDRQNFTVRGNYAAVRTAASTATYEFWVGEWSFFLDVRVFNEGVGFRYRMEEYTGSYALTGESTTFSLDPAAVIWSAPDYEGYWEGVPLADFQDTSAVVLPLVAAYPDGEYVLITESTALDYPAVSARKTDRRTFGLTFGHRPHYQREMPTEAGITTPWRVIMVNDDLDGLVNNPLVPALAPAPDSALFPTTDWIKPGRAGWTWISGGFPGQNYENMRRQLPALAQLGWEYLIVDDGWEHWPDKWQRIEELTAYGDSLGVGIILWKPTDDYQAAWQVEKFGWRDTIPGLLDPEERRAFFRRAGRAGVAGLKVDFVEEFDLERVNVVRDILEDAAREQLITNFHGASKPTGLERTYPNLLVVEAVRGMEHAGSSGDDFYHYSTVLPFTRYVIGSGDYTPYRGEAGRAGTKSHQLAMAVAISAPLSAFAIEPVRALEDDAYDLLRSLPTTWDETRVLPPSAIGRAVVMAKRKGRDWYLAVMAGREPLAVSVALADFLPAGRFDALVYTDGTQAGTVDILTKTVTAADRLDVDVPAGGGYVARLVRRSPQ